MTRTAIMLLVMGFGAVSVIINLAMRHWGVAGAVGLLLGLQIFTEWRRRRDWQ